MWHFQSVMLRMRNIEYLIRMIVYSTSHTLGNVAERVIIKQIDLVTFERLAQEFYSCRIKLYSF